MACLPVANVRECDDFGASAVIDVDAKPEKLTSPFRTMWIVPLIIPIIIDIPAISNKNLLGHTARRGKAIILSGCYVTRQGMYRITRGLVLTRPSVDRKKAHLCTTNTFISILFLREESTTISGFLFTRQFRRYAILRVKPSAYGIPFFRTPSW